MMKQEAGRQGKARPIYIYHKDSASKQYEGALNDSMVERVGGEMIVYPDRCVRERLALPISLALPCLVRRP